MKIKVSIQIIFKIMIIVLMIIYLPSYSHQNVKVFKAISTTEALQTSVPVTSNKKVHIYNTHQGEEYVGYNVRDGAGYLKDCLNKEGYFCDVEQNDFENYKNLHRIAYNQSYVVSKMYLENSLRENGQYDLVIDFHRDSLIKNTQRLRIIKKVMLKLCLLLEKAVVSLKWLINYLLNYLIKQMKRYQGYQEVLWLKRIIIIKEFVIIRF